LKSLQARPLAAPVAASKQHMSLESVKHRRTGTNLLLKALFTLGVKANVQAKSRIPIGAKLENQPHGLHTSLGQSQIFYIWTFRHTHCTLRKKKFFKCEKGFKSRFNLLQIGPWAFGP
jgi:hypothetical protein